AAEADDAAVASCCHPWSERCDEEERRPHVAGEHRVERRDLEFSRRSEERYPGGGDQDVDVVYLACEALHVGGIAEVGTHGAGLAARRGDLLDRLGTARDVAAMHEDFRPA